MENMELYEVKFNDRFWSFDHLMWHIYCHLAFWPWVVFICLLTN